MDDQETTEEGNGEESGDDARYYVSREGTEDWDEKKDSEDEDEETVELTEEMLESTEDARALIDQRVRTGHKPRINMIEGILMLMLAAGIDIFQILLDLLIIGIVVNRAVDIVVWLIFYLWFKMKGVSFGFGSGWRQNFKANRESLLRNPLVSIAIAFIIEFFPFIGDLPAWTVAILVILISEYAAWLAAKTAVLGAFGYSAAKQEIQPSES